MKSKYVLFVGPYPPPVHGQSFAFKMAYDYYPEAKILLSQNLESKNRIQRIYLAIVCILKYLYFFLRYDISLVYLAGSRSALGSFKDIILFYLAHWKGIKIIDHIHAAHFNQFLDSLPRMIRKYYVNAYKKVNVFVCLLPEMIDEYKDFMHTSKIEVIENFYDPLFDKEQEFEILNTDTIVISYFSNLIYSKGIFDLINAFTLVSKKYSNVRLQIAGNFGSDSYMTADKVRSLLNEYLISNPKIKFVGPQFRTEKLNFLRNSQIFVLPSFYSSEAFPISIIEAMRAGNAIVLTDHHYLASLIKDNHGIIVRVGDIEEIAKSIEKLILNTDLLTSMRKSNREFAKDNYSLFKYFTKLNSLIQLNKLP
ncbi:MAG: glycosyltransferase family 4 protein [Saprospiraceae bacterium]